MQFSPLSATCMVLPGMLLRRFKSSMIFRITDYSLSLPGYIFIPINLVT